MKSDRERKLASFERNKAIKDRTRGRRRGLWLPVWSLKAVGYGVASILAYFLAFPQQLNEFLDQGLVLRKRVVSYWIEPAEWYGYYTNSPEGVVNTGDYGLTPGERLVIYIGADGTNLGVDAYFEAPSLCSLGLLYSQILMRGHFDLLSPSTINLQVFDVIGGMTVDLGAAKLRRNGVLLTVVGLPNRTGGELRLMRQSGADEPEFPSELTRCLP